MHELDPDSIALGSGLDKRTREIIARLKESSEIKHEDAALDNRITVPETTLKPLGGIPVERFIADL